MKIIIIGAGPSGITSSIFIKRNNINHEVIILERNNTALKKLLMTGNGRCNYMNEIYSTKNYHSMDISLVDKIISTKNINNMKEYFDSLGIIPKIKNNYYYPFSNQALTIKNALLEEAINLGVKIEYNILVKDIEKINNKFIIKTNNKIYEADKVVLSTGSCAYPKTGSDGIGYNILNKLNHKLIKPVPALVQLVSDFKYSKIWDGVRSEVIIESFENNKFINREEGEIQLTKYGISGICTFNLSHEISRGLSLGKKYEIHINFVPFIDTLITPWLNEYSNKFPNKKIDKLLEGFLNYKIVEVLLKVCNIDKDLTYKELSKDKKFLLCKNLRSFKINIIDTKGFDNAQICNGGVSLKEININTMESLKVKGLYIIGELLDMNGNCGGYNLSTCWISGMLSGKSIGDVND